MKKGTIMKRITEAYTYGRITAKAEAILEKYGVKSSVILEKFTNDLGNHLGALLIKALDCAKSNGDEEAYNEIISCFAHLKKRVPFKKSRSREDISTQNKSQTHELTLFRHIGLRFTTACDIILP